MVYYMQFSLLSSLLIRYDLLNICLEGPQEKLNETVFCQPAVFVASLASLERLKAEYPDAIESCVATAGFSLGELTALTFAGAFPFDKGKLLIFSTKPTFQDHNLELNALISQHSNWLRSVPNQCSTPAVRVQEGWLLFYLVMMQN